MTTKNQSQVRPNTGSHPGGGSSVYDQPSTNRQVSSPNEDPLGNASEKVNEFIREVVEKATDDDDDSATTIQSTAYQTAIGGSDSSERRSSQTAEFTSSLATTSLQNAQSLWEPCSYAWTSASGKNNIQNVKNQETKGGFATAALRQQAFCLRYASSSSVSVFDDWISQCHAFIHTASIPATTTLDSDTSAVIATANIDSVLGLCSWAGASKQLPTPAYRPRFHYPQVAALDWTTLEQSEMIREHLFRPPSA